MPLPVCSWKSFLIPVSEDRRFHGRPRPTACSSRSTEYQDRRPYVGGSEDPRWLGIARSLQHIRPSFFDNKRVSLCAMMLAPLHCSLYNDIAYSCNSELCRVLLAWTALKTIPPSSVCARFFYWGACQATRRSIVSMRDVARSTSICHCLK